MALLAGCGGPSTNPGNKKVRVDGKDAVRTAEPREYTLVGLAKETKTFAARLPGKSIDSLITIDGNGNGSIVSATVDCGKKAMTLGSPRLVENGVASGRPGGPGVDGSIDMMTNAVCAADWKGAIKTDKGNLQVALADVKPAKNIEADRARSAYMNRKDSK